MQEFFGIPYELFRASHFHNFARYLHIVKLTLHFYVYAPLCTDRSGS